MASNNGKFVVGFTRLDGVFRHAEVKQGTKLSALLKSFGYTDSEMAKALPDIRIGGEDFQGGLDYVLKADDVIGVVPNVKGGR